MFETEPAALLALVIAFISAISGLAWMCLAYPLTIYTVASKRFAAGNLFLFFAILVTLFRAPEDGTMIWLLADVLLVLGVFLYKKGIYRLFRLPNHAVFDQVVLFTVLAAVILAATTLINYRTTAVTITSVSSAVLAMTVYAKYHALLKDIPRYGAVLMVTPVFVLTCVLLVKALSGLFFPALADALFLKARIDSIPILWIYLGAIIFINVAAIGAALMRVIAKIRNLADHDQLTGLLNRHAIGREISRAEKAYDRDKIPYSALLIDVDFFKSINDQHGHDAGDKAIRHVAAIMSAELRETDRLARYGGEEFLAVLFNCTETHASKVAEKLRLSIADHPFVWNNHNIALTVSIGVSSITQVNSTKALLSQADKALYAAKSAGRNRTLLASG
ncbi:GGDEF domain-containing protein [Alteromonas oceanisediminis]|uniref:GGDEF domain-containing protein n=1 Tax=Alteromonas oceanisediminis TaxID=2836180 RepID=UPI001BD9CEE5|nr:diguanylate cyclase [Alteromonas oceanisediminis]MBT0587157.1 GGDEF domain-containing protein [Alteromonas oceanisediminis]